MNTKNNTLAISIPTYNRASILKENISLMLEEIKTFSIPIYISDDSTNNETQLIVKELLEIYPNITYYKNNPSLGHDKNCIKTLSIPRENYTWYLGDSVIIKKGGIERILSHISNYLPDFIAVNSDNRDLEIASKLYTDRNKLLEELAWHLTMTSATIYSKSVIDQIKISDPSEYRNFPQTAIIFEKFAESKCSLFWENLKLIYNNSKKNSYWQKGVFQVFLTDWPNIINKLDSSYSKESKTKAIISHSKSTKLFSFNNLIKYKAYGFFSWKDYLKYFKILKFHSNTNIYIILIILLIPKFVLLPFISVYYRLKK
jgi:abequosyltransferase